MVRDSNTFYVVQSDIINTGKNFRHLSETSFKQVYCPFSKNTHFRQLHVSLPYTSGITRIRNINSGKVTQAET